MRNAVPDLRPPRERARPGLPARLAGDGGPEEASGRDGGGDHRGPPDRRGEGDPDRQPGRAPLPPRPRAGCSAATTRRRRRWWSRRSAPARRRGGSGCALPARTGSAVFLRAAELLAGPWRDTVNAATMLGQSKTCHQAEIDSACELIDFSASTPGTRSPRIYADQPRSPPGHLGLRRVPAAGGLRLRGDPVQLHVDRREPAHGPGDDGERRALEAGLLVGPLQLLPDADVRGGRGCPPGVINFVPGRGAAVGDPVLGSPHLAGIHFTGSTGVFQRMWKQIGENVARYRTYPRIVGRDRREGLHLRPRLRRRGRAGRRGALRGAFEYQGQKCSAASRMYVPAEPVAARSGTASSAEVGGDPDGRRPATSRTSWAR